MIHEIQRVYRSVSPFERDTNSETHDMMLWRWKQIESHLRLKSIGAGLKATKAFVFNGGREQSIGLAVVGMTRSGKVSMHHKSNETSVHMPSTKSYVCWRYHAEKMLQSGWDSDGEVSRVDRSSTVARRDSQSLWQHRCRAKEASTPHPPECHSIPSIAQRHM